MYETEADTTPRAPGSPDFNDPAFQSDPWPSYDWHREHQPVCYSEAQQAYFVFGHEHVRRLLVSPDFTVHHPFRMSRRAFGPTMLDEDGAGHALLRSAAAGPFRPRNVAALGVDVVRPLVEGLLDELLPAQPPDLVDVLARRLPLQVVCAALGLPRDDEQHLSAAIRPLVEYVDYGPVSLAEVVRSREELRGYFQRVLDRTPGSEGLLRDMVANDGISGRDVVNTAILVLAAGTETTTAAITNLLARLAVEPAVFARLRADRSLIPAVVAETLRHEPPLHMTLRFAARDVVLAGVPVPQGSAVQVVLASANRDPALFDRPERWDPSRHRGKPMTFGSGRHVCLGMNLATTELEIFMDALLDRVESITPDGEASWPVTGRTFRMAENPRCVFRLAGSGRAALR